MPFDDLHFEAMLARVTLLGEAVNALDNAAYAGVMATVNGKLRSRWTSLLHLLGKEALASEVTELLTSPRLSPRQAELDPRPLLP